MARAITTDGHRIRVHRELAGKTIVELAATVRDQLGIPCSESHLSHIEANRKQPSPRLMRALAAALRVPLAAIVDTDALPPCHSDSVHFFQVEPAPDTSQPAA